MTAINTLKKWFSNFKKPNQEQFWAWIDSFWHKSEQIPMSSIDGLDRIIEGTASAQQFQNHINDTHAHKEVLDKKVDKVEGKGLSSNDFTNAYKQQLDTLEDYDIELDESTTELKFKKGNNVVRRIPLMFLDDEGTKLVYNRTSKTLELRDKRDNLLTSIPVSHFVSNIPTDIVVQNGKIKLMSGSEVIGENSISYNDLADKPELNYLPLTGGSINPNTFGDHQEGIRINRATNGWSILTLGTEGNSGVKENEYALARNVNGKFLLRTIVGTNMKELIIVDKDGAEFLNVVRINEQLQVGTNGLKFRTVNEDNGIILNNSIRIKPRPDGNNIAFGNVEWNKLVYGEFAGIKIWNNVDNNKVVLAGGGVTSLDGLKNENVKVGGRNYLLNSKQTLITSAPNAITGVIGISPDFKKILVEQPTIPFVVSCFIKYTNLTSVSPKSRLGFEGAITYTDNTIQYINYWLNVSDSDVGKSINGERFYRVITLLPNKTVKEVKISGMFVQITADQAEVSNPKIEIGNKPTDWTPAPEDLANDRVGISIGDNQTYIVPKEQVNNTIYAKSNATIDCSQIPHLGSISTIKVYDGGQVTFTCGGKNIIYTTDNTFNGKKGSTAVVSIYENDC